jgi:hypothetical protein
MQKRNGEIVEVNRDNAKLDVHDSFESSTRGAIVCGERLEFFRSIDEEDSKDNV